MNKFLTVLFSYFFLLINPSFAATQPMQVGPIFASVDDSSRSFLRFYNTSNVAGTVTLIVRNAANGEELGEWTSPVIEPQSWKQYWIATIEGALLFPMERPQRYFIEVKSKFAGQFQHVVVNSKSSVLINLSSCSNGNIISNDRLSGVHSSNVGVQGYPSYVVVSNPTSEAFSDVELQIFDAQNATKVGSYFIRSIAKNSQSTISVDAIEREIGMPKNDLYHYTIRTTASFQGFLTHLVFNEAAGIVTDMTTTCAITLPEPLPVLRSSYENKIAAGKVMGPHEFVSDGHAFADFFQEGKYSAVTSELRSSAPGAWPDIPSTIKFWKKLNGTWVDVTSSILEDQTGCVHPRKALVADFNNDKKPDIFFTCHGHDVDPWLGENQRLLLSKPNGKYENKIIPFKAYAHGGSAADINGDGFADVVLTDTSIRKQPFYLKNNKNGTFTETDEQIPMSAKSVMQYGTRHARSIYSAELLDVNGDNKPDLWFGGFSGGEFGFFPTVYYNNGTYRFGDDNKSTYLTEAQRTIALDVLFSTGSIYMLFANENYDGVKIERVPNGASRSFLIYSLSGAWFPWIAEYDNYIIPYLKNYSIKIALK